MENQSLEKLAAESQAKLNPPPAPEKRGRGRPPGSPTTTKTTSSNPIRPNPAPQERPTTLGLRPTFGFLYDFLGKVFATQTACKEFEMEKHETEALAQQSDDLMVEFFPNVQSRWIKLVVFVGSVLGIYGKKYLAYLEQEKRKSPAPAPEAIKGEASSSTPEIVPLGGPIPINPNKRF